MTTTTETNTEEARSSAAPCSAFPALETAVLEYLDSLEEKERVERIDDLLHRLNFERRLTMLAPNQREAMNDRALHPTQRARLDACKTEAERDKLIGEMARTQYFRDCAWVDYLNGGRVEPPVMPNDQAQQRAANDVSNAEDATGALAAAPLFGALRFAVAEKRAAQAAYNKWHDGRKANGRDREFPTEEDVAEECRLRTKLGETQRAVHRAADAVADAPNDKLTHGGPTQ